MKRVNRLNLMLLILISLNTLLLNKIFAVSESGLQYMYIPVGARATGMGEANVAIADDPFSLYYNPAGLGFSPLANDWVLNSLKDTSIVIKKVIFPSEENNNLLYVLTNKGLYRWQMGKFYNYEVWYLGEDDSIEGLIERWVTDKENLEEYKSKIMEFNSITEDIPEKDIWVLNMPYSMIIKDSIIDIYKSKRGYIYLITQHSLVYFKNERWNVINSKEGLNGTIKYISESPDGKLWILTDQGFYILDQNKFNLDYYFSKPLKMIINDIKGFSFIDKDRIIIISKKKGLISFDISEYNKNKAKIDSIRIIKNVIIVINDSIFVRDSLNSSKIDSDYVLNVEDSIKKIEEQIKDYSQKHKLNFLEVKVVMCDSSLDIDSLRPDYTFFYSDSFNFKVLDSINNIVAKKVEDKKKEFYLSFLKDLSSFLYNPEINCIVKFDDSTLYIGGKGAIYIYNIKRNKIKRIKVKGEDVVGIINSDPLIFYTKTKILKYKKENNTSLTEVMFINNSLNSAVYQKGYIVASADDNLYIYKMSKPILGFSYHKVLPLLNYKDLYLLYTSIIIPGIKIGTLGFSITYLSYGSITHTDETGQILGTFRAYDMNAGLHWGLKLLNNLAIGLSAKFAYSNLAPVPVGNQNESGKAYSLLADMGLLWKGSSWSWGVNLANIGPKIYYIDKAQSDPPPTYIRLGTAYKGEVGDIKYNLAFDLHREFFVNTKTYTVYDTSYVSVVDTTTNDTSYEISITSREEDYTGTDRLKKELEAIELHPGLEIIYADIIAFRGGYVYDKEGSREYYTAGVGLFFYNIAQFSKLIINASYIIGSEDQIIGDTWRVDFQLFIK